MPKTKNAKDAEVKIACFYQENGKDVAEILRESFLLFVKSELRKLQDRQRGE